MSSRPCVGWAWRPSPALTHVDAVAAGRSGAGRSGRARPTRLVAHHEQVGVHGAQVVDGVEQASRPWPSTSLSMSRLITSAAQALGGDLEGGAGARRVLEEQVEDALAAQQRHLLDLARRDRLDEGARRCRGSGCRMALGRPSMDSRWSARRACSAGGYAWISLMVRSAGIVALELQGSARRQRFGQGSRRRWPRSAAPDRPGRPARPGRPGPDGRSRTVR